MDRDLTVPEAVLLLTLDDTTGRPVLSLGALHRALSGAALAEIVLQDGLRLAGDGEPGAEPGRLVRSAGTVDARLAPLVEHAEGRAPREAIQRILGWGVMRPPIVRLREAMLGELVADGALEHDETRWLGLTWSERWTRGSRTEVEDALQARARALLEGDRPASGPDDERTAAAIGILHAATALPAIFGDIDPHRLDRRATALTEGSWTNAAMHAAVRQARDAMIVAGVTTALTTARSSER